MNLKASMVLMFVGMNVYAYNPHQIDLLKAAVEKKEPILASSCDFRGVGSLFQGISFVGAQLAGATFDTIKISSGAFYVVEKIGQSSNLSGLNFSNANLVSTSFQGADLSEAVFTLADVANANFTDAQLTGALLGKALNLDTAVFCNTIMPDGKKCSGTSWTSASGLKIECHCAPSK